MTPAPLRVTKQTFAGNSTVLRVGKSSFGVPRGCKIVHPSGSKRLAYLLHYDQSIHAFVEQGEVELSAELQQIIRRHYFQPRNKN